MVFLISSNLRSSLRPGSSGSPGSFGFPGSPFPHQFPWFPWFLVVYRFPLVSLGFSQFPWFPVVPLISISSSGFHQFLWFPLFPLVSISSSGFHQFLWFPLVPLVSISSSGTPQFTLVPLVLFSSPGFHSSSGSPQFPWYPLVPLVSISSSGTPQFPLVPLVLFSSPGFHQLLWFSLVPLSSSDSPQFPWYPLVPLGSISYSCSSQFPLISVTLVSLVPQVLLSSLGLSYSGLRTVPYSSPGSPQFLCFPLYPLVYGLLIYYCKLSYCAQCTYMCTLQLIIYTLVASSSCQSSLFRRALNFDFPTENSSVPVTSVCKKISFILLNNNYS